MSRPESTVTDDVAALNAYAFANAAAPATPFVEESDDDCMLADVVTEPVLVSSLSKGSRGGSPREATELHASAALTKESTWDVLVSPAGNSEKTDVGGRQLQAGCLEAHCGSCTTM